MRGPYSSMYTDSTNTSTRSKIALATSVSRPPPKDTIVLGALDDFVLERLQRRLALL